MRVTWNFASYPHACGALVYHRSVLDEISTRKRKQSRGEWILSRPDDLPPGRSRDRSEPSAGVSLFSSKSASEIAREPCAILSSNEPLLLRRLRRVLSSRRDPCRSSRRRLTGSKVRIRDTLTSSFDRFHSVFPSLGRRFGLLLSISIKRIRERMCVGARRSCEI